MRVDFKVVIDELKFNGARHKGRDIVGVVDGQAVARATPVESFEGTQGFDFVVRSALAHHQIKSVRFQ